MTGRLEFAGRAFIFTVVAWLFASIVFAMPVLADDDDEEDGGPTTTVTTTSTTTSTTTTTTTTAPTTTTSTQPTTTTKPAPATTQPTTTTSTRPKSTTTTTVPKAPTTTAPEVTTTTVLDVTTTTVLEVTTTTDDDGLVTMLPGPATPQPQEHPSAMTDKATLVVTFGRATATAAESAGTSSGGFSHVAPRENLSVAVAAVSATLEDQILQAVILGILVATLTIAGVDRTLDRRRTTGPLST